jgi:hypothetical protein
MSQVSPVLRSVEDGFMHWCPGCNEAHVFYTQGNHSAIWMFDNNVIQPTFNPSMRMLDGSCHYFLRKGEIQFLNDCTHALAGKTVPIPLLPEHLRDH